MPRKIILILILTILTSVGIFFTAKQLVSKNQPSSSVVIDSKVTTEETNNNENANAQVNERNTVGSFNELVKEKFITASQPLDKTKPFNVLVLGIDRRTPDDYFYRTDVIQIASYNPTNNKVLFTSIPRDLWIDGNKINAFYILFGQDSLKEKIKQITGLTITRVVRVDFDALAWAVDSVGGVEVNVPVGFVDEEYPKDRDGLDGVQTVEFNEGPQIMSGETALIYARSRKGTNGEGSDFARSKRQQILMEAAPKAFLSPNSLLMPFNAQNIHSVITQKIYTDISVSDVTVLYDIIKNYNKISYERFNLGYENLINPPLENYGGAWVLVPKDNNYEPIKEKIKSLLGV